MPSGKFYILSISNSKAVENTQDSQKSCRLRKWNKSPPQQWTLEPKEGEAQTFAFKSVSDGRYLAGLQPNSRDGGVVGVADETQYWTLEPGRGPMSWQWKSTTIASGGYSAYLNDEWGRFNDDNRLQTYYLQPNNPSYFTFYLWPVEFADGEVPDASAGWSAAGSTEDHSGADKRAKELEERETAIAKTEAEMKQRAQQAEEKAAAVAKQEAEAKQKLQEAEEKATAVAKQEADAKQKASEQDAAIMKREAGLAQRERDQKATAPAESNGTNGHADGSAKQRALEEKEAALAKREADLAERERNSQPSSEPQANRSGHDGGVTEGSDTNDAEQLRARIAELEKQLGSARSRFASPLDGSIALVANGGVRPAGNLKRGWDPKLLESFYAGKKTMSVRRDLALK